MDIVRRLRHPNLLPAFGAWQREGLLIVAMELADRTLWDRYHEARDEGLQGIPREELLDYLREAAKGIDYLNQPHVCQAISLDLHRAPHQGRYGEAPEDLERKMGKLPESWEPRCAWRGYSSPTLTGPIIPHSSARLAFDARIK